ncbi:hypothetical protein Rhe02_03280 [Rhizocola hellebori]|uniref:Pycsar effector protein domain-containing protein n=1 Tax=Rhizocola hellebori TaxID=1392758 RepID=A0A8J3VD97_9ACTN|nr:Pycsar system effector family protein [Rhizocola hellebori]GIH02261.1 hypothetical protein Rhe02_03280 [Rhizocola hellebori]
MTHALMESWANRADLKASVLLTLQGGALVLSLSGYERLLQSRSPWPAKVGVVGVGLLLVATCLAALVIMPMLGSARRHVAQYRNHMIFFGHLRLWEPQALAGQLRSLTAQERQVMTAHQLVSLSRINWRKYRMLQGSVLLTIVAVVILTFLFVTAPFSG